MSRGVLAAAAAAVHLSKPRPPFLHPHHHPLPPAGHYGWDGKEEKTDAQAQIDMIDRLLEFGQVTPASIGPGKKVLDVGCGVGGSTRHIAKKLGCSVSGITLSPVQADHAAERSARCGMTYLTDFQVADALAMPFPDASFDLVWSLEVAEHFPDRQKWLEECYRVLKPGGRLLVATWTHRPCDQVNRVGVSVRVVACIGANIQSRDLCTWTARNRNVLWCGDGVLSLLVCWDIFEIRGRCAKLIVV